LQGFGGVIPVAQRELVDRLGWLDRDEFLELLSLAQVLPGPNIVNLGLMLGDRFRGARGAFAALTGVITFPLMLVMVLAVLAQQLQHHAAVSNALRGMGVVSAGMIASTALRLLPSLAKNAMGRWICALLVATTGLLVVVLQWPLVWVLLGLGGVSVAWAWRCGAARAVKGPP
jgi:chromate transporter